MEDKYIYKITVKLPVPCQVPYFDLNMNIESIDMPSNTGEVNLADNSRQQLKKKTLNFKFSDEGQKNGPGSVSIPNIMAIF